MGDLSEDQSVISAERWRAWEARGKRRHKAIARKVKLLAGLLLIGFFALAGALHLFTAR